MGDDESTNTVNSAKTEYLRPITSSGLRLSWADGNDARLAGLLHAVKKFWKRRHLFVDYFKNRAVPVGTKLAVDSVNAIQFVQGAVNDPRGYDDPCPPTVKRVTELASRSLAAANRYKAVDADKDYKVPNEIIIGPHFIEAEDARILQSLEFLIEGSIHAKKLIDKADGSGEKLLKLLEERSKKAKPKAKAVLAAEFNRLVATGIQGELSLAKLQAWNVEYETAKLNLDPAVAATIGDETELQTISNIAFSSPEVREMFELKSEVANPTDLESAMAILEEILNGRQLAEDIDRINGGGGTALAAERDERIATLEALVAELRDPAKDKKPPTQWVKAPRDKDNNVTHWIVGMQPCRCNKKQDGDQVPGGHLSRDCKTLKPKKKKPSETPAETPPVKDAAVCELVEGMTDEDVRDKLNSLFGIK